MHAVELLLDAATDTHVREKWRLLAEAGLPSQANHTGPTNAPHVTLAVCPSDDGWDTDALHRLAAGLALPVRLGGIAVFGRHRYVVVRLLVVDVALLTLHAEVWTALGGPADDADPLTVPGRWTPHVTLARGLSAGDVGRAIEVLGGSRPLDGTAVDCRHWDSVARRARSLRPE